ncbi:hypothetical protein [Paenibacillus sp. JJ1722]
MIKGFVRGLVVFLPAAIFSVQGIYPVLLPQLFSSNKTSNGFGLFINI